MTSALVDWRTHLEVAGRRLQDAAEQLEQDRSNMGEVFWLRDAMAQVNRSRQRLEKKTGADNG